MKYGEHWEISDEKKQEYINRLLPQLSTLRAKVGLSQNELASLVGISRQTYCLTESGARGMSWNTFLSVVMFFDYNKRTHNLIRGTGAFPDDLFYQFNLGEAGTQELEFEDHPDMRAMMHSLDDHGINAVKAVLASEYSRCAGLGGASLAHILADIIK